ncbi:hypothetical protein B0H12DRAFT_1117881 [Mycena haematopus]|nr:hypothetical protein B0H12DRAFT_1117881 [Mycena haematopus]
MPGNPIPKKVDMPLDLDVVFVHDATGSQQPYIEAARNLVRQNVAAFKRDADQMRAKGVKVGDPQYRVIAFRDHREQGDAWFLHDSNPFTNKPEVLEKQLAALEASGGGDGPEAQLDALDAARRSSWRVNSKKVVLLITDSPPHGVESYDRTLPRSHPSNITVASIAEEYNKLDIHLTVIGCTPEINSYQEAVKFYKHLTEDLITKKNGMYLPLPPPTRNPGPMNRAIVGTMLHAADNSRLADKWGDWIADESYRGHDALVDALHSTLSAQGEECHEVSCTEHGGHDIQYHRGPVSRARVDAIVGKTLSKQEDATSNILSRALFG